MKLLFGDIETLREYTLFSFWDEEKDIWYDFSINKNGNGLYAWVKFMEEHKDYYFVMFNSISFDSQVMEWVHRRYDNWHEKDPLEIAEMIWKKAADVIDNQNHDIRPMYREDSIFFHQIDLFRIHGFGNDQKRTSLKWVEFAADLPDIEPMPLNDDRQNLTNEEIEKIRLYCHKDIRATYVLWLHTIGEVENEVYKGKNKIQERLDAIQEFGLPSKALNFSDVKLGEVILLKGYMEEAGIEDIGELYERKRQRGRTKAFTFGECIPNYVSFSIPVLKELRSAVDKEVVRINDKKQKFVISLGGLDYTIAKGGLHTKNKACIFSEDDDSFLVEIDCSSQYPASIVKRGLFPSHLGKEWLINYRRFIQIRIDAKERGKTNLKDKGIAETLKLCLNGGGFGKTGETFSVQYDPLVHFSCTIGNQFEILMLIEWLLADGVEVLSANTDGALCRVKKAKKGSFMDICKRWEGVVGNTELGKLEYTYYQKYVLTSVNDYLAIKDDGTLKQKGDFLTDSELNKNKSRRVVPLALKEYFTKGTLPDKYIPAYERIYDFCIGVKASKDYYFKAVAPTGEAEDYKRIVRYFVSTDGKRLLKVKVEGSDATGNPVTQCEAPDKKSKKVFYCTVANSISPKDTYSVDYDYYIQKANKIIAAVEKGRKERVDKSQLILF